MATLFIFLITLFTTPLDNQKATIFKGLIYDATEPEDSILYTGWYYVADSNNGIKMQLDKTAESFYISPNPIVTAKNIKTFEIHESYLDSQAYIILTMRLDKMGTKNWSIATEKAIGKQLAFVHNNKLLQVSKVNSQIKVGVTALHRGVYSRQELEHVIKAIENEKQNSGQAGKSKNH